MRPVGEIAREVAERLFRYEVHDGGDITVFIGDSPEDTIELHSRTSAADILARAEQWVSGDRASALPVLVAGIEQALREFQADGMPPTTVSEERLAEIRGWADLGRSRRAEGRVDGSAIWHVPINRSDDPIVDLLAHIDVLEARIRDMSQDDVGEAWKAGHREGRESVTREMRGAASRLRSMHSQRAVPVGVGDVLVVGEVRMEGQKADVDALMSLLGVPHQ